MFSLYKFFEVASLCVWTLEVSSNRFIYGVVLWACGGFLEFAWKLKEIFVILKLSKKKKKWNGTMALAGRECFLYFFMSISPKNKKNTK